MFNYKLILILFIFTISLFGSDSIWNNFFQKVQYGQPFVSEIHSTANKLEMGYDRNYDEYNLQEEASRFDRPIVIIDLGLDLPIYASGFGSINGRQKWEYSMSYPISVHILEDMFEAKTAPLINTDFGFGSPQFNLIRRFSGDGFFKNISFVWLPYYHQCTHLGDEIIIYRTQVKLPIIRINVSYYYTELKLTINDPDGSKENLNSFKFGMLYRLSDHGYGWFGVDQGIETTEEIPIEHSEKRLEYYFDYRYQRSTGFWASKRALNIFSIDIRNRVRYNYPVFIADGDNWITKDVKEASIWSFNVYFGWKFYTNKKDDRAVGIFLRLYHGVNPFGQLRNYPNYRFGGISVTYDL